MSKKTPDRDERLAAALRANLKRRKDAQRAAAPPAKRQTAEPATDRPKTAKNPG